MLPLPDDLYYMPYGRPAVASVTFLNPASTGNTLTINGVVYTFGTDWGSRFSGTFTPNYVPGSSVRDLAELINGVDDQGRGSLALLPNATVFARAAGNKLLLFAREPGTAGNSYTLSTNNSAAFVVSGATFSGGTAGSAGGGAGGAVTIANGADVALGSKADVAETDPAATASLISLTKGLLDRLANIIANIGNVANIGSQADALVTDPTASASEIALLKGLLSGGVPVTPHIVVLGASASQTIPVGAHGWSFAILTGTATVGGASGVVAGVGDSYQSTLAATLTVATDADSSAYVSWNT